MSRYVGGETTGFYLTLAPLPTVPKKWQPDISRGFFSLLCVRDHGRRTDLN